jgi:gliding motility-associated-like protein
MKKILFFLNFFFLLINSNAQDLALAAPSGNITAPISGCGLTASEAITVSIFNFGTTLPVGSTFNVSYTVNGGAPVSELVTLAANFAQNSSLSYTFSTTANLSVSGTYTLTATVLLAGDINAANDTYTNYQVINNSPSVGGTIAASASVCITSNSGVLTLSGQTGNVLNWEYSEDGGITWLQISNTGTTQSYSNITDTTQYRAKVQNANCPTAFSNTVTLTTNPATVGGTVSTSATRCISGNSGTLSLTGKVGSVVRWEFAVSPFTTFTPIANTGTTQTYLNLTQTTRYRAVVQSGVCPSATSSQATITISPLSVGGDLSTPVDTVCAGANSGTITLSGQTGSVTRWEFSTNNGTSWTNISNTTTSQTFTNLAATRWFRALVTSGACSAKYSDTMKIVVTSASVAGFLSVSDTVCAGSNSGTLQISGFTGSISDWEYSTNNGASWNSLGITSSSFVYSNLDSTTLFHAIVQAPGCSPSTTTPATITVNVPSVGGTTSGSATVCASGNTGSVQVSSTTGTIQSWLSSTDNGLTWSPNSSTNPTFSYSNLDSTTTFAAVVVNGVCPADTSSSVVVIVDPVTVGGIISSGGSVCSGANNDTLFLSGYTGVVQGWEYSTDGGTTWLNISNLSDTLIFNNLTTTSFYRVLVKSGVCSSAYSSSSNVSVDPAPVGGTVYGGATVCATANSGTLTLVGHISTVSSWENSIDNGITWNPIANTSPFESFSNLTQSTWYRAIVSSGVCPTDTSSIAEVIVDSASFGGIVSADDTVCANQNGDTLVVTGNIGNVVGWQISTDGGSTWISLANATSSQSYSNLAVTTEFRTEIKNGVCPSATSVVAKITVDQASVAGTISSPATVCETYNGGVLLLSGTNGSILDWESSTDGGLTWTSLANTGTQQAYSGLTDTTLFHAIAQSGVCVADTGNPVTITVIPKPTASFTAQDTCFGLPTFFTNTSVANAGYIQLFNWDFDDNTSAVSGNPVHQYSDTGTFNVELVALSNFGCLDTFTLPVKVFGLPSATFTTSGPVEFCNGDSVVISVPFATGLSFEWNTADTTNSISVDTTGNWAVMVMDSLTGCMNTGTISTVVFPAPEVNAGVDDTLSLGNSLVLTGSGNGFFSWSPAASLDVATLQNPTASPTVTTTYTLVVTSINGCTSSDSVKIVVEPRYEFVISTVITPNGDGFNDKWFIKNLEFYPTNEVVIFNRYGQKVFGMTGYDNSWDGTFGGSAVPDGTYYYVLKFGDNDKSFNGAITVLRASK